MTDAGERAASTRTRLAYGAGRCQFGDLYLPAGGGPHPVVIFIHGGYWRARYGLEYAGPLCRALAAEGSAVWSIEYRRVGNPGGGWPGTFEDVAAAAGYLRVLARQYPLDLDRVVVMGHSAGGHLALWLAGAWSKGPDHAPGLLLSEPLPLRGVVALAPVADLRRAWELGLSDGAAEQLLGGAPSQVSERYTAASPPELLPLGVHQVVIHGAEDEDVPCELSAGYCAAATAAGDEVTLVRLQGMGHFEPVDPSSPAWPAVCRALEQAL